MQSVRTGLQRGLQRKEVCHRDGADAGCSPVAARKKYSAMMAFSFLLRLFPGMAAGRKTQGLVRGYRFSAQSSSRAHSKDVCRHKKGQILGRLQQARPVISPAPWETGGLKSASPPEGLPGSGEEPGTAEARETRCSPRSVPCRRLPSPFKTLPPAPWPCRNEGGEGVSYGWRSGVGKQAYTPAWHYADQALPGPAVAPGTGCGAELSPSSWLS